MQIPKNPRKLKRFIENEIYAQDARFWMGKLKTADRGEVRAPVNRQSRDTLSRRKRRVGPKGKTVSVYAVHFRYKSNPTLSFLKVGVTAHGILKRFEDDAGRYDLELIHETKNLTRADALVLESALHAAFASKSFRPPAPLLSGGNSECFEYSEEFLSRMKKIVSETLGYAPKALR